MAHARAKDGRCHRTGDQPVCIHFRRHQSNFHNYANSCRFTGTPEELVLDFGLNTQMTPSLGEDCIRALIRTLAGSMLQVM
jgi:hypothetical protein